MIFNDCAIKIFHPNGIKGRIRYVRHTKRFLYFGIAITTSAYVRLEPEERDPTKKPDGPQYNIDNKARLLKGGIVYHKPMFIVTLPYRVFINNCKTVYGTSGAYLTALDKILEFQLV